MMWNVDDLNIFHIDYKVVDFIIKIFDEYLFIYAPLTATRGKIHNHLSMVIYYTPQGNVLFTIFDYI